MPTVKVLQKVAGQIQAGATYEDDAMTLFPVINPSAVSKQLFDLITPEGVTGTPYQDIPLQGPRHHSGVLEIELDAFTSVALLEAAFGDNTGLNFSLKGSNTKKMSICVLNAVKAIKQSNVFVKSFKISGQSGQLLKVTANLVVQDAQDRQVVGDFPEIDVNPGDPFSFHEMGGIIGYFRVGDCGDALSASDDLEIEEFSFEVENGFDEQFCNVGVGTLQPLFAMTQPKVSGSFKVSRHSADTFQAWRDANTLLQLQAYLYKSASENITMRVPAFVCSGDVDDSDVPRIPIEMQIGRNGIGTAYRNANMTFNSPIDLTIVNA